MLSVRTFRFFFFDMPHVYMVYSYLCVYIVYTHVFPLQLSAKGIQSFGFVLFSLILLY